MRQGQCVSASRPASDVCALEQPFQSPEQLGERDWLGTHVASIDPREVLSHCARRERDDALPGGVLAVNQPELSPMVRRRVRSISAIMVGVLVGALAGGCGDATGPGGLAGAYRLERYEGREIPAVVT